jgi:RHH-type proline utilization regulon transcriptional repressor/proline dehydrogenase/delta 1-pyrroline-5-carboxylate dehydrogenase
VTLFDDELIARSCELAAELERRARSLAGPGARRRQRRFRRLLASPSGAKLVFAIADRVLRPVDARTAAAELAMIAAGPLEGFSATDRALLRVAGVAGRLAPFPVVKLVTARLRRETRGLIYPAEPRSLRRHLSRLRGRGNLNLLGEAVLGWDEATRRARAVEALLRRDDVACVSVKVSSVSSGLSLVDFDGSVERVCGPLRQLFHAAASCQPPKLVNLDMEEHGDLDLTLEAFFRTLGGKEGAGHTAGIALQAYLPGSHEALERVLSFAAERHRAGAPPVRVRLVKGANLAMEQGDAELRCWPQASYLTKAETDASYKAMLERLLEAARNGTVEVGVASHNLFDVGFSLVLAEDQGVKVEIEMLAGMADEQAAAIAERTGGVLLYVPVAAKKDFRNALAYLSRRLDENTSPEGFLRYSLDLEPGSAVWEEQASRFATAVRARHEVRTRPYQEQDRQAQSPANGRTEAGTPAGVGARAFRPDGARFSNEPDTDLTVPSNREWARALLDRPRPEAPAPVSMEDVEQAVSAAREAVKDWEQAGPAERAKLLTAAAEVMAAGPARADAIAVMASEAGKTFEEADPEVSEAVDFARWYAEGTGSLSSLFAELDCEVASSPLGVVVVSPPWNFPFSIPAGGVLAALAAGNTVILKPARPAMATGAVLVEQLHAAGFGEHVLQLVAPTDRAPGQRLVTHPDVNAVVLTGSWETASNFARWAPSRRILAETSGKGSIIVGSTADVDQAVRDVVHSAFSHAGQKCSAGSLAIVLAPLYDRSPFLRQLADAVRSLRVGGTTDPATEMGPLVGPFTPDLERALTRLEDGESWLVKPACIDPERKLWSPGVRIGVRPGSWAHMTEWFGPVLGVMRAETFEEALAWQNAVAYGLTAGLSSLDPEEHRRWAAECQAGNLYINRAITGAIVGRQPFGGWKRSILGPTAKAGGPNYLIALRRWHDAENMSVAWSVASYRHWWEAHFSRVTEMAGLACESNELSYEPFAPGVVLRAGGDVTDDELTKAVFLAELTGTPLRISVPEQRPALPALAGGLAKAPVPVTVESADSLAASLAAVGAGRGAGAARLRVLGEAEQQVVAAAAEAGVSVFDEPICSCGRIELVRWLREKVVARSLHRYGNIVYSRW